MKMNFFCHCTFSAEKVTLTVTQKLIPTQLTELVQVYKYLGCKFQRLSTGFSFYFGCLQKYIDYITLKWKLLNRGRTFSPKFFTNVCQLCTSENYPTIFKPDLAP